MTIEKEFTERAAKVSSFWAEFVDGAEDDEVVVVPPTTPPTTTITIQNHQIKNINISKDDSESLSESSLLQKKTEGRKNDSDQDQDWSDDSQVKMRFTYCCNEEEREEREPEPKMRGGKPKLDGKDGAHAKDAAVAAATAAI